MQPDFALAEAEAAEIQTREIYRGVIPFVAIQIVTLFILASFPSSRPRSRALSSGSGRLLPYQSRFEVFM